MKKLLTVLLLLALPLTGCGQKSAPAAVDLSAFFEKIAEEYDLAGMTPLEGELLEVCYPGLTALAPLQLVAYAPMISSSVNEYVFVQCRSRADAEAAAEIMRSRIAAQAQGGAWYPESMAAWSKAQVVVKDAYALMIASWDGADEIIKRFSALL